MFFHSLIFCLFGVILGPIGLFGIAIRSEKCFEVYSYILITFILSRFLFCHSLIFCLFGIISSPFWPYWAIFGVGVESKYVFRICAYRLTIFVFKVSLYFCFSCSFSFWWGGFFWWLPCLIQLFCFVVVGLWQSIRKGTANLLDFSCVVIT